MRLQVAFDYLMVFTFVLLVFTVIFSSISKQSSEFSSEQSFAQLQIVAQTIASEISYAGQGGNGYAATFYLPSSLSILLYNISLTKYGSVIVSTTQFGQTVQAVAFGGQYNVVSNSSYLQSNTFYLLPTYNGVGTITFQNSLGTICVDFNCPSSSNQIAQMLLSSSTASAAQSDGSGWIALSQIPREAGTNSISYAIWFDTLSLPNSWPMVFGDYGSPRNEYDMFVGGAGSGIPNYLATERWAGGLFSTSDVSTNPLLLNTWYFAVVTYDGSNLRLYLNGVLQSSSSSTASITVNANELLATSENYNLANFQVYGTALTANQVAQLYQSGITGAPLAGANVIGWWPLNGNTNDYSGNGNNGAVSGPLIYPAVAQLQTSATNSTGKSLSDELVDFYSSLGNFTTGPSTFNITNATGIASTFLTLASSSGQATVTATAFNGNYSTTANLIAWFPMNQGQGSTLYGVSPQIPGPGSNYIYGSISGASWAFPNYVAHFDGQTSYIPIPSSTQWLNGQLTINGWVNVTGTSATRFSWFAGRYGSYAFGVCGRALILCYYDYSGFGGVYEHDSGANLLPNTWYMVTAVISNGAPGTEKLYVNGVQVLSGTMEITSAGWSNVFQISGVAPLQGAPTQFFNGSASNVQMYPSALGQNQIIQIYQMGIGGSPLYSCAGCGWWPLDGDAYDHSGSGYNGIMYGNIGMSALSGFSAQSGPSSLLYASFNGVNSYVQASNVTEFQTPYNTITISGWAKYVTAAGIGWLAAKVNAYGLGACGPSLLVCYYNWGCSSCSGKGEQDSNTMLTSNTWYMMTAVINGQANTETIYVNGANVITGPLTLASTANALDIGFGGGSTTQYLNGGASNIQVYGTALTQPQIQQLYQQGMSSVPLLNAQVLSWFPLDGDTSDYSNPNPNNRTASVSSNILYYSISLNPPGWTPSISGYGVYFNGATSYIATGTTAGLPLGSSARSVFAWVYPSSLAGVETIYNYCGNGGSDNCASIGFQGNQVEFSTYNHAFVGLTATPNTWHFVGYTYSTGSTSVTLYLDGQSLTGSITNPLNTGTSISASFIGIGFISSYPLQGSIADVQVYNSALNSNQISQLYYSGMPLSQTISVPLGVT